MGSILGLARVSKWLKRRTSPQVGARAAAQRGGELLIPSLEYELSQVRRAFSDVSLEKKKRPAHELPRIDPSMFELKLRRPGNRMDPRWWAVLGLNQ